MAIPTTRTQETGRISVDESRCNGCGLCVMICKDFGLELKDKKAVAAPEPAFGCFACGHCMAVCPEDAIFIEGRELSPADLFEMPSRESATGYDSLMALLQRRRSTREFKDKAVDRELIDQVLAAARTAPMGIPPSDVNVLVFDTREKANAFTMDFVDYLKHLKWMTSSWFLALMKPFWTKANLELFRDFIGPLIVKYTEMQKQGNNYVTYDPPVLMYFYGSPYCDPADPLIPATYAMLAAESLGLGTCMLGAIHPFIQQGGAAAKFREKHGIKYPSKEGIFVAMGYPKMKFKKGIRRTFASVTMN